MKRTRALIVPFIAMLATPPFTGCGGDVSDSPGPQGGDSGNHKNGKETQGSTSDGDTPDTGNDSNPDDGSTSTPDDSTGSGGESPGGKIDCSKLEASGIKLGQVPPNVTLVNAKGDKVNLHDYCNDILYVMAGSAF